MIQASKIHSNEIYHIWSLKTLFSTVTIDTVMTLFLYQWQNQDSGWTDQVTSFRTRTKPWVISAVSEVSHEWSRRFLIIYQTDKPRPPRPTCIISKKYSFPCIRKEIQEIVLQLITFVVKTSSIIFLSECNIMTTNVLRGRIWKCSTHRVIHVKVNADSTPAFTSGQTG